MIYKNSILTIIFGLAIFSNIFTTSAQQVNIDNSWLDKSLVNWNRQGNNLPSLPNPVKSSSPDSVMLKRCSEQIRKPLNAAEKAVARKGWKLYGASQIYEQTQIFTALSGFDGMCRPLGYQAFVYWEGRYAGTLSPVSMNSRTDGSMTNIRLTTPTTISADYMRYKESDALCCPSRISYVNFELKRDDVPSLMPTYVRTEKTCSPNEVTETTSNDETNSIYGKRWVLTKIGEKTLSSDKPFIKFDRENMRASGDAGCNLFSGGFTISDSSLKFSPIAGTLRACVDSEENRLETEFLQSLSETTRFEIQGDTLKLYANKRLSMVFKKGSDEAEQNTASITGTVSYLQRIALSPNAVIKVQLLDVSKADAKAEIIAEQTIKANGRQVPFNFELRYNPNVIKKRNRYVVRAEIFENGKLQFTNTKTYPVITNGGGNKVEVIVNQVR